MNIKTTAIILVLSAMTASASSPLLEEWGGDLIEREYNQARQLTRLHIQYVGGAGSHVVMDKITSISPWDGVGDPDPEWEIARGTVWLWWGDQRGGYTWTQKVGEDAVIKDIEPEHLAFDPVPAPGFWGIYVRRGGLYRRAGGFHCGVANGSDKAQRAEVNVEWFGNRFSKSHTTTSRFFAPAGKIGWTNPRPSIGEYAWASDRWANIEEVK